MTTYSKPAKGLFITGTDTEVGKTYVASMIARSLVADGYRVGVYKPSASDCIFDGKQLISEDAIELWQAAGQPLELEYVCPQRFKAPLAPHLAARVEGREVDSDLLRSGISAWTDHCDIVVVEGAGGLMSPINEDEYVADLAADFGYPLIVVAANALGAINQTLQTLIAAANFRCRLGVAGVVLNDSQIVHGDISIETNREEIARRIDAPLLAHVGYHRDTFDEYINWYAMAENELGINR
jgi:dethiobiotin synthetase